MKPTDVPAADQPDLAEAILRISDGMRRLAASGLNRRAIVALLRDATSVSKRDIEAVLDGLSDLANKYTAKPKAEGMTPEDAKP